MTTGISAPPMAPVMCQPSPPERAVDAKSAASPIEGLSGNAANNLSRSPNKEKSRAEQSRDFF